MVARLNGGIAFDEVLVDPAGATVFGDGNSKADATDDVIELVNAASSAISIAGLVSETKGLDGSCLSRPFGFAA